MLNIKSSIAGNSENKASEGNCNKTRHLVEIDYNILGVFVLILNKINEMHVANGSNIERYRIESLIRLLEPKQIDHESLQNDARNKQENTLLGKPKQVVTGYEDLTILEIHESSQSSLIKSDTQLEHTVDKILAYYYDLDEIPKSLF